jgi:hypothetical protein
MMNSSQPVCIWMRFSTVDYAKCDSLEHHERRVSAYAESDKERSA